LIKHRLGLDRCGLHSGVHGRINVIFADKIEYAGLFEPACGAVEGGYKRR
jgi:hypothetical protein